LSAKILAVQNVFTDRRAYVNALTYSIETETSASSKKSKQTDLASYKKEKTTVAYPTVRSRTTITSTSKKPTTI